jgi:nucleotidyltransferase/DNA polymerase involved in DNA repair
MPDRGFLTDRSYFYESCEGGRIPSLRDVPMVVAGDSGNSVGVIVA